MKTNKYHVNFDIDFKRNEYPGKLIALEGLDGSGKTTQSSLVAKALEKLGHKVIQTKEPTDHPTGKFLRQALSRELDIPPVAIQYLYGADRAVHQKEIIEYLKKGYYIVTDRYFWSSVAYGASDMGRIDDYQLAMYSMLSFYNRFLLPNITFYLKVSPSTGLDRIEETGKQKEIYENIEKLKKIEKGYDFLLQRFPDELTVIDAGKSVEKVTEDIIKKLT